MYITTLIVWSYIPWGIISNCYYSDPHNYNTEVAGTPSVTKLRRWSAIRQSKPNFAYVSISAHGANQRISIRSFVTLFHQVIPWRTATERILRPSTKIMTAGTVVTVLRRGVVAAAGTTTNTVVIAFSTVNMAMTIFVKESCGTYRLSLIRLVGHSLLLRWRSNRSNART